MAREVRWYLALLIMAAVVGMLMGALTDAAFAGRRTCDDQSAHFHKQRAFELIDHAYSHGRWEDKSPVKDDEREAIRAHKFCLKRDRDRDKIGIYRDQANYEFDLYRLRRLSTPFTGGGHRWAIPYYIVLCESGADYTPVGPYPDGGAYGVIPSTWRLYGGPLLSASPTASGAAPIYQDIIAHRVWVHDGPGAWACA